MLSQDIRRSFLQFFKQKKHVIVPSSSVVPHDDPSLLFINAGMNQFKDVFLGKNKRDYTRAATAQKCIRVGGKHNDLDNVGHTSRHLTLFEMLGNFSFGDYFKEQAIAYAWEVSTQVFSLPEDLIWVTIFEDDDEAFELWKKIVPANRIVRMGEKDNFWSMGDTGPCGPCSELLFDRGKKYGNASNPKEDVTGEKFLEFWNLVFMQFNKDGQGNTLSLPNKSIDTGAGLERLIGLKMGVDTVFETDIFRELIAQIENVSGVAYSIENKAKAPAFHVIADHIRSLSFAIADGAQPGNIDRGYVLRKILRRAVRYAKGIGIQQPFLAKVLPRLIDVMGEDYPELILAQDKIGEVLTLEEEAFFRTLKRGGNILSHVIEKAQQTSSKQIEGEDAFKLKDTYGLPLEEILLVAKDFGLQVNLESYQILEELAKEKSRAADTRSVQVGDSRLFETFIEKHGTCVFTGYTELQSECTILGIIQNNVFVEALLEGQEGILLLNQTPFYAEKGGQVGDTGIITHHKALFNVTDCQTPFPGVIAHKGRLDRGVLIPGEPIVAHVEAKRRQKIASNHTATHLLHGALQAVLGAHIRQAGSLVESSRLRFDFNHHKAITKAELRQIEEWVSTQIRKDITVKSYEISYEEAQQHKEIKQFFGEKYGSHVRVVEMPCSKELCGGTHTAHVGSIGLFRIIKESSIAAGVRRIEAVCGEEAEMFLYEQEALLDHSASLLKCSASSLSEKIQNLLEENKSIKMQLKEYKKQKIRTLAKELKESSPTIGETLFIAASFPLEVEDLSLLADDLIQNQSSYLIVIAAEQIEGCHLIVRLSADLQARGLHAGQLVKEVSRYIQGSGGGKADLAQAGGKHSAGLPELFDSVQQKLQKILC